jgi:hypothetical protein
MMQWAVRIADNTFVRGNGLPIAVYDPETEIVVDIPDDVRVQPWKHRYDPESESKIRDLNQQEIAAQDTPARLQDSVTDAFKASVIWGLENRLGREPTPQEIGQAVARVYAIYKQIRGQG